MSSAPSRWDVVAREKLERVIGGAPGLAIYHRGLAALELESLQTADELHRFGQWLTTAEPGFAGAVGGLLAVHAVVHGARASSVP